MKKMMAGDTNKFVVETALKAQALICNEIMENCSEVQRWLIYSRVLNYLYTSHYHLSMDYAEEQIEKCLKPEDANATK